MLYTCEFALIVSAYCTNVHGLCANDLSLVPPLELEGMTCVSHDTSGVSTSYAFSKRDVLLKYLSWW